MVTRTFVAFDNDNLIVTSSSSAGIVGNGVINNSSTPNGTIFSYTAGSGQDITVDDNGGSSLIFDDDNAANHVVVDGGNLVAINQTVEAESIIEVRALDANGNETGPTISITVFSQGGSFSNVWGLSSDIPLEDGTSYVKTDGSNAGASSYDSFVTCFSEGTVIDTPNGPKMIESLNLGDLVQTRDNGAMPVRWIGQRRVLARGKFAPIRIEKGALQNSDTLLVSPEHRMVVEGPLVEFLFGIPWALVAAKFLVGLSGITQAKIPEVTYFHLLFDNHQLIKSAGCWSESFFLAENSVSGLDHDARQEIDALFPDMPTAKADFGGTAGTVLKSYEASLLKAMMNQTEKPAFQMAIAA